MRPHSTLLLALAAPRRMPRRAMAADDVTMETYYYGNQSVLILLDSAVDNHEANMLRVTVRTFPHMQNYRY